MKNNLPDEIYVPNHYLRYFEKINPYFGESSTEYIRADKDEEPEKYKRMWRRIERHIKKYYDAIAEPIITEMKYIEKQELNK
jgi:hypothetical protein